MQANPAAAPGKPISIAILAMGGQGGGVLADWIVSVAEVNGWHAQSTSVPGVAQRTGATLYYIEMLPPREGQVPVFALMPTPGDVDVVIASELMEAGRSVLRGLVTPDKTLLITSTHRAYAVAEKEKPGQSIGDPQAVHAAAGISARRVIACDLDNLARISDTVISAPILGALAGSGALPFARASFEQVIAAGGKGTAASLNGFAAGFSRADTNELPLLRISPQKVLPALPGDSGHPALNALVSRIQPFPEPLHGIIFAGLRRVVDYQDVAYGAEYLDRVTALHAGDIDAGGQVHGYAFTATAAKYLANAMAYDDVIGVADVKTAARRFHRVARDVGAASGHELEITEFMHPGAEEMVRLLPAGLGRKLSRNPVWMKRIDRLVNRGRRIETTSIRGFVQLYLISALRPWRRKLLRHSEEMAHVEAWLALARQHLASNYRLAEGIITARRLIKGYSDTHAHGLSKYDRVLSAVPALASRDDAGAWMSRLVTAALKDEDGTLLDGALQTVWSLDA